MCGDARTGRIATVSLSTGDIAVRGGAPPFRIQSSAPGVAAGLAAFACAWSPDGRQIAIGNAPAGAGLGGSASVALYDVATKTLRVEQLSGEIALAGLFYSPDSKTVWAGGVSTSSGGVHRISGLDQDPRVRLTFLGASAISTDHDGQRLVVAYPTSVRVFDAAYPQTLVASHWPDRHDAHVRGPQLPRWQRGRR